MATLHPVAQSVVDVLRAKGYYERSFDIVFSFKVQEDKENELLEKIRAAVPESRKEKGCLQFDFSRDLSEPVYVLYERWENGVAFEKHFEFEYSKELLAKIGEVGSETNSRITSVVL